MCEPCIDGTNGDMVRPGRNSPPTGTMSTTAEPRSKNGMGAVRPRKLNPGPSYCLIAISRDRVDIVTVKPLPAITLDERYLGALPRPLSLDTARGSQEGRRINFLNPLPDSPHAKIQSMGSLRCSGHAVGRSWIDFYEADATWVPSCGNAIHGLNTRVWGVADFG